MPVVLQTALAADNPAGCPLIGWDNRVTSANVAATTADASFPISNVANPATHLKWKGTYNTGDEYITITGLTSTISYVGVAKHNWGTLGIPVSVEVQTANSPSDWAEVIAPQVLVDDSPIIFRFTPQSTVSARIKLAVTDTSALPEAAVVYVGQLLVLERSIKYDTNHIPVTYGRRTNVVSGVSNNGNFLGRVVIGEYRSSKAEFEWFTSAFYRASIDDFLASAQELPFFWAWSPVSYPAETGYVWLVNDAEPAVDPVTQRIALTLDMRGVV